MSSYATSSVVPTALAATPLDPDEQPSRISPGAPGAQLVQELLQVVPFGGSQPSPESTTPLPHDDGTVQPSGRQILQARSQDREFGGSHSSPASRVKSPQRGQPEGAQASYT